MAVAGAVSPAVVSASAGSATGAASSSGAAFTVGSATVDASESVAFAAQGQRAPAKALKILRMLEYKGNSNRYNQKDPFTLCREILRGGLSRRGRWQFEDFRAKHASAGRCGYTGSRHHYCSHLIVVLCGVPRSTDTSTVTDPVC